MTITSLAFLTIAERFFGDLLSPPSAQFGKWTYQRVINIADQSATLQIFVQHIDGSSHLVGTIFSRIISNTQAPFLQGWIKTETMDTPTPFLVRDLNPVRIEENAYGLVDSWASLIMQAEPAISLLASQ